MEIEDLMKKLEQLEKDKEELLAELFKFKRKPEGKIGYLLLFAGLILLVLAVVYSHNVSAFIGIALTFWGALLLYIRPIRFIRKEMLNATIIDQYNFYHTLLDEQGYTGTPQYISPRTVWGIKNTIIYIPKSSNAQNPTDEQLSTNEVFIKKPQGVKMIPPGQGLSRLIEDELKTNFSHVDLEYIKYNLENAIVESLEIAEVFQMEFTESFIHVETKGTVFEETIQELNEYESKRHIGDPLNSAIACILARSTKQPVIIETIELDQREEIVKTDFRLLELSRMKE